MYKCGWIKSIITIPSCFGHRVVTGGDDDGDFMVAPMLMWRVWVGELWKMLIDSVTWGLEWTGFDLDRHSLSCCCPTWCGRWDVVCCFCYCLLSPACRIGGRWTRAEWTKTDRVAGDDDDDDKNGVQSMAQLKSDGTLFLYHVPLLLYFIWIKCWSRRCWWRARLSMVMMTRTRQISVRG